MRSLSEFIFRLLVWLHDNVKSRIFKVIIEYFINLKRREFYANDVKGFEKFRDSLKSDIKRHEPKG